MLGRSARVVPGREGRLQAPVRGGARRGARRRRGRGRREAGRAPSRGPSTGRARPRARGRGSAPTLASPASSEGTLQPSPSRAAMRSVRVAPAADDDRDVTDRPGVARRLGQRDPLSGIRLGAGRPERPHRLDRPARARRVALCAEGNSRPYAACSRSHQPAPTPTKARPPDRADSVAAALAVMPGARKVTGVTSVPSWSRVVEAASAPRVTHGSGIGSHARPTCGIWMRWSMSARPAKPGLLGGPGHVAQPREQVPLGREARDLEHDAAQAPSGRRAVGGRRGRASTGGAASGSGAASGVDAGRRASPPPRAGPTVAATGRELARRGRGAGTGRSRAALRERHTAAGVSRTTATAGSPAGRAAAASQRRRRAASVPRVSTTVVRPRPTRAATTCSSRANASTEASRSCSPLPTTPRNSVRGDDLGGAVARRRPGRLARARGADEHDERRVGQGHGAGSQPRRLSASGGGRGRRARPTPCGRWAPR